MKKGIILFFPILLVFSSLSCEKYDKNSSNGSLHISLENNGLTQETNISEVFKIGDYISIFNKTTENEKWQISTIKDNNYGTIAQVSKINGTGKEIDNLVAIYPYNDKNTINGNHISTFFQEKQTRTDDNPLKQGILLSCEKEKIVMKNLIGLIKIELTGTKKVKEVLLRGNLCEILAAPILINLDDFSVEKQPSFDESRVLTLECGEGVILSSEPTSFYFSVIPQVFEEGINVTVNYTDGSFETITSYKSFDVKQNDVVLFSPKAVEIQYVTSNKRIVDNSSKNPQWWSNVISNTYDVENNVGILYVPEGKNIGNKSFQDVTSLLSIKIPDNMEGAIEYEAFSGCTGLKEVQIGNNINAIQFNAFENCTSLQSVIIPDCVTDFQNSAFKNCNRLKTVIIGEGVKEIQSSTFKNCTSLENIDIPDNVIRIGSEAFYNCILLKNVKVGNGVINIESQAFNCCTNLTDLVLGDGILEIGSGAFAACRSLNSVNFPESVVVIGQSSFSFCDNLKRVFMSDSVTEIKESAFKDCYKLTEVILSNNISCLQESVFQGCSSLQKIEIPDNVAEIGRGAFANCTKLSSVEIPDGVTAIQSSTFFQCSSLRCITIPVNVNFIGYQAFYGCSNMTSIYCKPDYPPVLEKNSVVTFPSITKIYVPQGALSSYNNSSDWKKYSSQIYGYYY